MNQIGSETFPKSSWKRNGTENKKKKLKIKSNLLLIFFQLFASLEKLKNFQFRLTQNVAFFPFGHWTKKCVVSYLLLAPIFVQLFWVIARIFRRQLQVSNCVCCFREDIEQKTLATLDDYRFFCFSLEKKNNHWSALAIICVSSLCSDPPSIRI